MFTVEETPVSGSVAVSDVDGDTTFFLSIADSDPPASGTLTFFEDPGTPGLVRNPLPAAHCKCVVFCDLI